MATGSLLPGVASMTRSGVTMPTSRRTSLLIVEMTVMVCSREDGSRTLWALTWKMDCAPTPAPGGACTVTTRRAASWGARWTVLSRSVGPASEAAQPAGEPDTSAVVRRNVSATEPVLLTRRRYVVWPPGGRLWPRFSRGEGLVAGSWSSYSLSRTLGAERRTLATVPLL